MHKAIATGMVMLVLGVVLTGQRGPRVSPHESVKATIDGAEMTITYGRPSMRGRTIFGALVPYGRVWCPGADEATTLTTDKPLKFGPLTVPAGTYTLYTLPGEKQWQLIVSKKTGQWGIPYPAGQDLGRAPMTVGKAKAPAEQLTIALDDTAAGGTLRVEWGTTSASVPFTVG